MVISRDVERFHYFNQGRFLSETKKIVLFPEIDRVKIFMSLTRPHSRMCIKII